MSDPRSRIPSVDRMLLDEPIAELIAEHGRPLVLDTLRDVITEVRREIADAPDVWEARVEDVAVYAARAQTALTAGDVPSLRRVINATGVVLHTNLGRAPLADVAVDAMQAAAGEYTNLEFDLAEGVRGSRYVHCVSLLTELTDAEDALVVNNAAGALVLAINTICRGRGVVVSRGELVEIGGGFRIPEVLERAGATLVEVGSTNRTRAADYAEAIADQDVAAVLKVHRSNFRITGFTEEVELGELAGITVAGGLPLLHDLGSGLMLAAAEVGLPDEPLAAQSLADGVDVVVVSGDKLLGGPQAGILLGSGPLIADMRKNPLCRALRVDKVTLAGLEATLRLYRNPERARADIPVLRMIGADPTEVRSRADALAIRLEAEGVDCRVVEVKGAVGGGTFPGVELPSWAVEIPEQGVGLATVAARLRQSDPVVVGRVVEGTLRLDLRTVFRRQEAELERRVLEAVLAAPSPRPDPPTSSS